MAHATVLLRAHAVIVTWVFVDGRAEKRAGKLVDIDIGRVRSLVERSHAYLLKLARDAGVDIRRG